MLREPLVIADVLRRAQGGGMDWQPFRPGIEICRLYEMPEGSAAALLRYAPGAKVPRHAHVGYEHLYILQGAQSDERGEYRTGSLVINPPGSSHSVSSPGGCLVLAIWERPVAFLPQ